MEEDQRKLSEKMLALERLNRELDELNRQCKLEENSKLTLVYVEEGISWREGHIDAETFERTIKKIIGINVSNEEKYRKDKNEVKTPRITHFEKREFHLLRGFYHVMSRIDKTTENINSSTIKHFRKFTVDYGKDERKKLEKDISDLEMKLEEARWRMKLAGSLERN